MDDSFTSRFSRHRSAGSTNESDRNGLCPADCTPWDDRGYQTFNINATPRPLHGLLVLPLIRMFFVHLF
jgi:hypothetical protein